MNWLLSQTVSTIGLLVLVSFYALGLFAIGLVSLVSHTQFATVFRSIYPQAVGPIGAVFALMTGFLASETWPEFERARKAVVTEANGLADLSSFAVQLPPELKEPLRTSIQQYVDRSINEEWPAMAVRRQHVSPPNPLAVAVFEVLQSEEGRSVEHGIRDGLLRGVNSVLDARRERIFISQESLGRTRIMVVVLLGFGMLLMTAMVHANRRVAQWIVVCSFATAAALAVFVILVYDQPFARGGYIVSPNPLLEVRPR
jgi:hypothetical protein